MKKILLTLLIVITISTVNATTWYVTQSGAGTKAGTSWANASDDLATIIKNASASDEVWIASGTYKPKYDGLGNDVSGGDSYSKKLALFDLSNGVSLYGGFVGNETAKSQRTYNALNTNSSYIQTILSGMVSNVAGNWNDYTGDVVGIKYLTTNVTVDGIVIQDVNPPNIYNNGFLPNTLGFGAGMLIFNARNFLTVSNCKFTNNGSYALSNVAYAYSGANDSSNPIIKNCYFVGNLNGGGTSYSLYNYTDGNINTGVWAKSKPSITNCVFRDNTTMFGIGNYASGNAELKPTIDNCILYHTGSSNYGGAAITNRAAMWVLNTSMQSVCKPTIKNTVIAYCYGYAIYNGETDPTGGKVCEPEFINNTIYENAGQAYNAPYDNDLYQVLNNGTNSTFTNSIVWTSNNAVGNFYNHSSQNGWGGGTTTSNPVISYSNIKGGYSGTGNIDAKPLFVNPNKPEGDDGIYLTADDGFQNATGSPVIDAGTTSTATTDILGTARPVGAAYDLGAYEGSDSAKCSTVPVSNLSTSNITTSSAIISWKDIYNNGTQSYDIYIAKSNVAPDNAATPTYNTGNLSYSITGLDYGTIYYYWVRSNCSSSSTTSAWVGSNFSTPCAATTGNSTATISVTNGSLTACPNTSITFEVATLNFATTIDNYNWYIGGTLVSSGTNQTSYTTNLAQTGRVSCIVTTLSSACPFSNHYAVSNDLNMNAPSTVTPTLNIYRTTSNGNNFGGSRKLCENETVYFASQLTNDVLGGTYQWNIGGSPISGANSTTFSSSSLANNDVVTCTFVPNNVCLSVSSVTSNSFTAIVYSVVTPTISINADNGGFTYCDYGTAHNTSLTLSTTNTTSVSSSGNPSYTWKVNGGTVGSNPYYNFNTVHNGDVVSCTMNTSHSCATTNTVTDTKTFTAQAAGPSPSISIETNTNGNSVCSGTSVTYTATVNDAGSGYAIAWYKNSTLQAGETGLTYTPNNYQNVYALLTANNHCYPSSYVTSNTIQLTVLGYVSPSVSIGVSPSNTICAGTSVTFSATPTNGGNNPAYQWKKNGTNVGSNSATYSASNIADGDAITCVMTSNSNANCITSLTATSSAINMHVNNNVTPSVSIVASASSIISGQTVTFTATPVNGGYATHNWYINGVFYASAYISNTLTISTLSDGDVVTDTIISNLSCLTTNKAGSNGITVSVTVPTSLGNVTIDGPSHVCANSTILITSKTDFSYPGIKLKYNWYVNNILMPNDTLATFIHTASGSESINLTITANGYADIQSNVYNSYIIQNQWTGFISNDWSDDANWSMGVTPANNFLDHDACILYQTAGMGFSPSISGSQNVSNIFIEAGASISLNWSGDLAVNGSWATNYQTNNSFPDFVTISDLPVSFLSSNSGWESSKIYGNTNFERLALSQNSSDSLTIAQGASVNITGVLAVNSGKLIINESTTNLKSTNYKTAVVGQVTGTISGNITVERKIPQGYKAFRELSSSGVYNAGSIFNNWQEAGRYNAGYGTFVTGSACTSCNSNGFNASTGLDNTYNGYKGLYNYHNNQWTAVSNTKQTNLDPFTGYHLLIYGDRSSNLYGTGFDANPLMNNETTIRTTGHLVTGDVIYSESGVTNSNGFISSNNVSITDIPGEGSFIANPYACGISWSSLSKTNLESSYWYFDPTYLTGGYQQFVAYNALTNTNSNPLSSSINDVIQSGQAFWVQADSNVAAGSGRQLVITESNKTIDIGYNAMPVFKGAKPNRIIATIWKKDANNTLRNIDGAVAVFDATFNKKVGKEDGRKFWNSMENITIQESGSELSIDGLPLPKSTDSIYLKLTQMTANNTYTLRLDIGDYTAVNGMNPYLLDRFLNTETALTADSSLVSFTPTSNLVTFSNRFVIVFKPSSTLPAKFISINATHVANGNMVKWVTTDAADVVNYMVESSNTGTEFKSINTTAVNARNEYYCVDEKATGKTYYRIKAISKNGQIDYSKIVLVNQEEKGSITVVPNPVENGNMNIAFNNIVKGNYTLVMYSRNGQEVFKTYMNINDGSSMQIVPINQKVSSGIYTIKLLGTDYLTNVIIK